MTKKVEFDNYELSFTLNKLTLPRNIILTNANFKNINKKLRNGKNGITVKSNLSRNCRKLGLFLLLVL